MRGWLVGEVSGDEVKGSSKIKKNQERGSKENTGRGIREREGKFR